MDERIRQDHRLAEAEALGRLRALQPERAVSQRITEHALSLAREVRSTRPAALSAESFLRHYGLSTPEGVAAAQGPLVPPSAEARERLLSMAQRGSVRGLLEELKRLEAEDPQLGPWVGQLRALVRGFQLKDAQTFLQA